MLYHVIFRAEMRRADCFAVKIAIQIVLKRLELPLSDSGGPLPVMADKLIAVVWITRRWSEARLPRQRDHNHGPVSEDDLVSIAEIVAVFPKELSHFWVGASWCVTPNFVVLKHILLLVV